MKLKAIRKRVELEVTISDTSLITSHNLNRAGILRGLTKTQVIDRNVLRKAILLLLGTLSRSSADLAAEAALTVLIHHFQAASPTSSVCGARSTRIRNSR